MDTSTPALLRLTVAALMHATGETQADLGAGLRVSQAQISRRQSGRSDWSLADLDALARHYALRVPDLLRGPTEAVRALPPARLAPAAGGTQTTVPV
ncbi:helix-turn-helix domain-containing protein [Kitasatospora sp. NPDC092039]|uniref:helix-turn-helix domain-containing protein n=1 Tax=Kitasatospora sp. NPDC092039 TaxID=3364086 RepID=UPI0038273241